MLKLYLQVADIPLDFDCFIFRGVTFWKKSGSYKLRNSRVREILLDAFGNLGVGKSKFGLHSLRSGGATAAANAGVSKEND